MEMDETSEVHQTEGGKLFLTNINKHSGWMERLMMEENTAGTELVDFRVQQIMR